MVPLVVTEAGEGRRMGAETLGLEAEGKEEEKMPAGEGGRAEDDCDLWAGKAAGQ